MEELQAGERPWLSYYPFDIQAEIDIPDIAVQDLLLQAASECPQHEALEFFGRKTTYRALAQAAESLAAALQASGIGKGDRVAIMLPNCPQTVIAYFGTLMAGAIVVMTNPLYVERELSHQLKDSGACAIIMLDALYPRLANVRGELPELAHVIVTSIADALPFPKNVLFKVKQRSASKPQKIPYGREGVVAYTRFMRRGKGYERPALVPHDDLALLQYTGGTTGQAKGVMLTHRNLVANTVQNTVWCNRIEDGKEIFLAALPLFHVFGLTVLMNQAVLRKGLLILLPRFNPASVLEAFRKHRPTVFPGAPTMYVAIMNAPDVHKYDLSSIKVCVSGAAPLPLDVQQRFEALTGGKLIEGYGLTETSPVSHANPIWGRRKIGTIGLPLPNTDARVVDPNTHEVLPYGEVGELQIKGPQVMAGYWNRPEATREVLQDGWLSTGDLAKMDDEGYFIIVGRRKEVIIAGGFNIYPREIEEVLYEHPAIREAAVIGVQDPYRGETVKAFIVLAEGRTVSPMQLDLWCRERLAAFKVPHDYEFREGLPMSMIGKVLHRKLKEEAAEIASAGQDGEPKEGG